MSLLRISRISLEPSPRYARIAEASGGYGERVERADELAAALARAETAVREEGRHALLDVRVTLS